MPTFLDSLLDNRITGVNKGFWSNLGPSGGGGASASASSYGTSPFSQSANPFQYGVPLDLLRDRDPRRDDAQFTKFRGTRGPQGIFLENLEEQGRTLVPIDQAITMLADRFMGRYNPAGYGIQSNYRFTNRADALSAAQDFFSRAAAPGGTPALNQLLGNQRTRPQPWRWG